MVITAFSNLKSQVSKQVFLVLALICVFNAYTDDVFAVQQTVFGITQTPVSTAAPIPPLEERVETLEQEIKRLEDSKTKDVWDKLNAVSGLISGGLVAAIGIVATYLYNERQRKNAETQKQREIAILQVQTVQSFMPQLQSGQPKEIEAALLAITALGNAKLATELADIYRGEGAISALSKIAASSNREAAEQAEKSLEVLFNSLTDTVALVSSSKGGAYGSGFFVGQDGLCVTFGYVIADQADIIVTFRNVKYKAQLVSSYSKEGLVLLRVENGSFPVLPIPEKVQVESGEEVFVLGRDLRAWSFSSGEVDGFLIEEPSGERLIKVKVKVSRGYGGAPVINRRSEVVGIVASTDREGIYTYLLPVEQVFKFIHQNKHVVDKER